MLFYARERKIRFLSIMVIVFIDTPISYRMGYDPADKAAGGNGYRFGYGQTWSGSIGDARTARCVRD